MAARSRHDPARFVDVQCEDLVGDPIGTVQAIYRRFGLPWTVEVRAAVEAEHAVSRSGSRAPWHRYALEDFGIAREQVEERFAGYDRAHRPG